MKPKLLTTSEAAALLDISPRLLNLWRSQGLIRGERYGVDFLFTPAEVERVAKRPRPKRGRPVGANKKPAP